MVRLRNTIRREFHFGANKDLFEKAQALRKNMTPAEKEVWKYLRNRNFYGLKFRRQHPLRFFIADFYCHEELLVVEIDGDVHKGDYQSERDDNRTAELESLGIRVVRFTNSQVLKDINGVLQKLEEVVG